MLRGWGSYQQMAHVVSALKRSNIQWHHTIGECTGRHIPCRGGPANFAMNPTETQQDSDLDGGCGEMPRGCVSYQHTAHVVSALKFSNKQWHHTIGDRTGWHIPRTHRPAQFATNATETQKKIDLEEWWRSAAGLGFLPAHDTCCACT